jgi:hypothetical protein
VFHTSHSCTSVPPAGALTAVAREELYTVQRIWGLFQVKGVERARPWRPTQKRPTSAAAAGVVARDRGDVRYGRQEAAEALTAHCKQTPHSTQHHWCM